jgi:hypothetical protein
VSARAETDSMANSADDAISITTRRFMGVLQSDRRSTEFDLDGASLFGKSLKSSRRGRYFGFFRNNGFAVWRCRGRLGMRLLVVVGRPRVRRAASVDLARTGLCAFGDIVLIALFS